MPSDFEGFAPTGEAEDEELPELPIVARNEPEIITSSDDKVDEAIVESGSSSPLSSLPYLLSSEHEDVDENVSEPAPDSDVANRTRPMRAATNARSARLHQEGYCTMFKKILYHVQRWTLSIR
jgi:hypothetical protein